MDKFALPRQCLTSTFWSSVPLKTWSGTGNPCIITNDHDHACADQTTKGDAFPNPPIASTLRHVMIYKTLHRLLAGSSRWNLLTAYIA